MSPFQDYERQYGADLPYETQYFGEEEVGRIARFMEASAAHGPIVVVGHSYGADAAITAARRVGIPLAAVVGIDPVGKTNGGGPLQRSENIGLVVTVNGEALDNRQMSNVVESLGRAGGGIPEVYRQPPSATNIVINMSGDHWNFPRFFTAPPPGGGSSARDWVYWAMRQRN